MSMFSRRSFSAAVAVVALSALAACGSSGNKGGSGNSTPGTQAQARSGGTATYISNGELRNLEPSMQINAPSNGSPVMDAIFDSLYTMDSFNGPLQPRIATSFTSPDGVTWTMKLRPGVLFSDGTPLDAAAVKFSWDRMSQVGTLSQAFIEQLQNVTVKDPQTLIVTLKSANRQFDRAIPYGAMTWIVSPTAVKKEGNQGFARHPVGAGPFMLQSWVPNSKTVLVRNPHYWQPGLPKLDKLIITPNPDTNQAVDVLASGQAQAAFDSVGLATQRAKDDGLKVGATEPLSGGVYYFFNSALPPFNDIRARKAVTLAIDPDKINQQVFEGNGEVPKTVMLSSSPFFDPSLTVPKPNAQQAQQLFDEIAADGKPLSFTINGVAASQSGPVAKAIQAQLSKFKNVTVKVNLTDVTTYGLALYGHKFQMANGAINTVDPEPMAYSTLHSGEASNFGGLNDPQLDKALDEGRTATTLEARKAAYADFQRRLIDDYSVIWMWRFKPTILETKNATGIQFYGMGSPLFDRFGLTG
jgi:peptide/nickel transport system substrate-binding protein